jgi:hypothetical protein
MDFPIVYPIFYGLNHPIPTSLVEKSSKNVASTGRAQCAREEPASRAQSGFIPELLRKHPNPKIVANWLLNILLCDVYGWICLDQLVD